MKEHNINIVTKHFPLGKGLGGLLLFLLLCACSPQPTYHHHEGMVFGTVYSITYLCDSDLQAEVDQTLQQVDNALSMFNDQSVISAINRGEHFVPNTTEGDMFLEVFFLAQQVSDDTGGAFDITVAPLVNAWGFGFRQGVMPDSAAVDSIRQFVGWQQVSYWTERGSRGISKHDTRTMLDCSAIAKGYGVDAVARMLANHGCADFMIEIGGEVVTCGQSPSHQDWRIGVTKPTDDTLSVQGELQTILAVSNAAMATSGNYRNFYYRDGRKYAHTIDPHTGRPVQHELLSATVIAPTCAIADAYATAFMVLGLEKATEVLDRHPELMAYFIYTDPAGELSTWYSDLMKSLIIDP